MNLRRDLPKAHRSYPDDVLSSKDAFYAVVGIALNTMVQPSGRILGLADEDNFMIRSSPLTCALSILRSLQLVVKSWHQDSLKDGLQLWVDDRFPCEEETDKTAFGKLQEYALFRTFTLMFGGFLPIIKIFTTSGVPCTKALCTPFILSYCADELLLYLARRHNVQARSQNGQPPKELRQYSKPCNYTIWILVGSAEAIIAYALSTFVRHTFGSSGLPLFTVISYLSYLFSTMLLQGWRHMTQEALLIPCLTMLLPLMAFGMCWPICLLVLVLLGQITEGGLDQVLGHIPTFIVDHHLMVEIVTFAVPSVGGFFFQMVFLEGAWTKLPDTTTRTSQQARGFAVVSLYFVALNMLGAALCYGLLYDPMNTSRWRGTDWLP